MIDRSFQRLLLFTFIVSFVKAHSNPLVSVCPGEGRSIFDAYFKRYLESILNRSISFKSKGFVYTLRTGSSTFPTTHGLFMQAVGVFGIILLSPFSGIA